MGSASSTTDYGKCIAAYAAILLITISFLFRLWRKAIIAPCKRHVIFITGCDSGLGYSIALYAYKLGLTVVAGCLQVESDGAKQLKEKCPDRLHIIQLDITNSESVNAAAKWTRELLEKDPNLELKSLVNNAGIMIFGEYEWLTEKHIMNQININVLGTMRITKALCPLIRKYKGRIIVISSHCALATLPGLSVYGASKAALAAWCDGLRIEQAKYGVPVITVIPGSFAPQSNIMSRQKEYAKEMEEEMSSDDLKFYGNYFKQFNDHLSQIPIPETPVALDDDKLYVTIKEALLSKYPYPHYVHEPLRYKYYHFLFKISPTSLRDYFIQRFMQMPAPKEQN
ncbi:hypothetical protein C0J52_07744 [Blattella germanica]|nr:hypothetical protein C0J52_07744 [Blattella germanica]